MGVWSKLKMARTEGIRDFILAYNTHLSQRQYTHLDTVHGTIGMAKDNSPISIYGDSHVGICLQSSINKGARLCLTGGCSSIKCSSADQTLDAHVIEISDPTTILHTITLNGGINQPFTMPADPIDLPLSVNGKKKIYCIVYEHQDCKPYNYELHCGCDGQTKPSWMTQKHMSVNGLRSDGLGNIGSKYKTDGFTYGLLLDFQIKCSGLDWMCTMSKDWWCTSDWGMVATKIIQIYSSIKMIQCTIGDNLNFTTLTDPESLYKRLKWLESKADKLMPYLVERTPVDLSDCFVCNPGKGFKSEEVLV